MKRNIDYFGHEVDAIDNRKFLILRAFYGGDKGWAMEGKFWALNCLIGKAEDCKLNLSLKGERARIARALDLSLQELDDFINVLRDEAELLEYDDGVIWTEKTQEDLARALGARQDAKNRRTKNVGLPSANEPQTSSDDSRTSNDKNHQSKAMQCKARQYNTTACNAGAAAAAAVTSGEVATALSSCPFASRLTGTDHGHIAERLTGLSLGLGFVGYCVERTREAKPKNPGGFLRAALYGTAGFEGYPEAYQEQARKPAPAPARKPAPQTCAKCGSPLKLITDEAVCPDCGAAWYWDEDWQSWEQSSETWQEFDISSGIAALRAKAGDQKQTPAKQTAKQTA